MTRRFFLRAYGEEIPLEYGISVADALNIIADCNEGRKGRIESIVSNVTLPHSRLLNEVEGYSDEHNPPYKFVPASSSAPTSRPTQGK